MYNPFHFYYGLPPCFQPLYSHPELPPFAFPSLFCSSAPQAELTPIKLEPEISSAEAASSIPKTEPQAPRPEKPKASRFKYAKKNVESNVVNQVISYITTKNKSNKVLTSILGAKDKVEAFYEIMKQGKKQINGYIGRLTLQSLFEVDELHPIYIMHKKLKARVPLKLNEIRRALRLLTCHFLRNIIVPTLLTSSKLDKSTLQQHLVRAREITYFVCSLPSPYSN
jgi:hypothetical protein